MKTSKQIVRILLDQYLSHAAICLSLRHAGDDEMANIYAEKRAAIYEALFLIADFDSQLVDQWLTKGCED